MSEASFISITTLDAALDQVSSAPEGLTAAGIVGYKQGKSILRQRIGGQFLRNQGHYLTPHQLTECAQVLQKEVSEQKAPLSDTPKELSLSVEYWRGYAQGVESYQTAIVALHGPKLPTPSAPTSVRRRTP